MIPYGMKISELIEELRQLQKEHGDVMVFAGGEDYPGGVDGASYVPEKYANGYVPSNSVRIHARHV